MLLVMRILVVSFLIMLGSVNVVAQEEAKIEWPLNESGKVQFTEVVPMEGRTKDELFSAAKAWFTGFYADQSEEIYMNDRYEGKLAGQFNMFIEIDMYGKQANAGAIAYNMQLFVKEGKYKYNISGIEHEANRSRLGTAGAIENDVPECGTRNMQQRYWDDIKKQAHTRFVEMVGGLKEGMNKVSQPNPEDDW